MSSQLSAGMGATRPELWYSFDGAPFTGNEPFFFDTRQFSWVAHVEKHWTIIRDELMEFAEANDDRLEPYMEPAMVSRPKRWRVIGLKFWGRDMPENVHLFPRTRQVLKDVPGLNSISFNLLEENSTIKPHNGDTNAIIRCHLGLVVPAPAPRCGFRVGSEVRSWEEGRMFLFCDAHEHTAWNNTDGARYVMVIDVVREEFMHQRNAISNRVIAAIELSVLYQKVPWLARYCNGRLGRRLVLLALMAAARVSAIPGK